MPFKGRPEPDLDLLVLCEPYLVEMDHDGRVVTETSNMMFHCSGIRSTTQLRCGQPLFRLDSILSKKHMWRIPGSHVESAWYINDFMPNAIYVASARPSQLAQGIMETADVLCARCKSIIGWKFVSDLCAKKHNMHYVHRFGVCCSAILELEDMDDTDGSYDSNVGSDLTLNGSPSSYYTTSDSDPDDPDAFLVPEE